VQRLPKMIRSLERIIAREEAQAQANDRGEPTSPSILEGDA
jgi:hypothetical protein